MQCHCLRFHVRLKAQKPHMKLIFNNHQIYFVPFSLAFLQLRFRSYVFPSGGESQSIIFHALLPGEFCTKQMSTMVNLNVRHKSTNNFYDGTQSRVELGVVVGRKAFKKRAPFACMHDLCILIHFSLNKI